MIGAGISLGVYALYKSHNKEPWTLEGVLISGGLGAITALLPDILEPSSHPNHRGAFHSWGALAILILSNHKILQNDVFSNLSDNEKLALILASVGYGSHLLVDSQTPKGLPIC